MNRLYRFLLRIYPRGFRERLGPAMAETFAEEMRAARRRGPGAVLLLWIRTVIQMPLLGLEERLRDGLRAGSAWATDLRLAVRGIRRSPALAVTTALTVGVGVGATTALFTVADSMLLRPLSVPAPERLVRVAELRDRHLSVGMEGPRIPFQRYRDIRQATTGSTFTGLAGHNLRHLPLRADGPAFPAAVVLSSGNYFEVLGVRPALGRFFASDQEPSVVLGHRLWQGRFAGSSDVIGRSIHIAGQPFTVVGVAPADFASTIGFLWADLWAPLQAHEGSGWSDARVTMFGRLAPGVERGVAEERLGAVVSRMPPDDDPNAEVRGAALDPLTPTPPSMAGPLRTFLAMLLGAAVLVLLIAGANIAGLLIARTARRSRETAVRLALGVGRGRLLRQSLLETVLLFLGGGLVGVGIAVTVTRLLAGLRFPTAEPVLIDASPDPSALLLALASALVAGVAFGVMPAIHASSSELAGRLRDGGRSASRRGSRTRDLFVTAQLAMSVLLLVTAVLFVRTAHRGMTRDPGFSAEGVVVAKLNLSAHDYGEEQGRAFYRQLLERAGALPGVESASLAQIALLTGESSTFGSWRLRPDDPGVSAGQNVVDARYFETMEIELLIGRGILETDVEGAPHVVVVSESFARRFWPDGNPVGKTVLRGEQPHQVVGVVADGDFVEFGRERAPFTFLSSAQRYNPAGVLHLRLRPGAEPAELIAGVRGEVAALDPDVAVEQALPLETAIGTLLFPQQFAAALIGTFGLLGLLLAATGIYGVLAHHVVQRTREFGIRIALGAHTGRLLSAVLRRGVLLALAGALLGLGAAAALTRFLQGLLHGVSPFDAFAFLGVPLLLCVVAILASALPARRVLALDPVEAFRRE